MNQQGYFVGERGLADERGFECERNMVDERNLLNGRSLANESNFVNDRNNNQCCCCCCCVPCRCNNRERAVHVHELQDTVMMATGDGVSHNHRYATMTGVAIASNNSHVHEVFFRTDSAGHIHEFSGRTGFAIMVSGKDHVHFLESVTTTSDGHRHNFQAATLVENPLELSLV